MDVILLYLASRPCRLYPPESKSGLTDSLTPRPALPPRILESKRRDVDREGYALVRLGIRFNNILASRPLLALPPGILESKRVV
jgi:hypothetical protein